MSFPNFPELRNLSRQRCRSCLWNCWGGLVPHNIQSPVDWCHKELHLRCCGKREVCLCHYPYYYHYFSNWTSFKIHLIWAHLKFHYKLLFRSASATIPESKFSSSTFYFPPLIKLYKLKFFTQCFDCAAVRKQFEIISDTHE